MKYFKLTWIIVFFSVSCSPKKLEERFPLNFPSSLKRDWKQVNLRDEKQFLQIAYKDKEMTLIVSRYEASELEKRTLFQGKIHQLKALFATQFTPYGGVITQKTSCLKNLNFENVVSDSSMETISFVLDADERLNYGQCLDQAVFKSHYQILNCTTKPYLYEIKFFYPANSKEVGSADLKSFCL